MSSYLVLHQNEVSEMILLPIFWIVGVVELLKQDLFLDNKIINRVAALISFNRESLRDIQ